MENPFTGLRLYLTHEQRRMLIELHLLRFASSPNFYFKSDETDYAFPQSTSFLFLGLVPRSSVADSLRHRDGYIICDCG